jgi:hypothetical protein
MKVRTWREKCTTNKDGSVCIPARTLKQAIDTVTFKLGDRKAVLKKGSIRGRKKKRKGE